MNKVTVIGSINLDRTIRVKEMAKPGETIHASEVFSAGGGKGANQAVAAKRSGAKTAFIGAVGHDEAGQKKREILGNEEKNLAWIAQLDKVATGQAYIVVDEKGENSIMIHAGANGKITPEHVVKHADLIKESDFVIAQFESDLASTIKAFEVAHQAGVKTILNPAPAMRTVPEELLKTTDVIAPNETETEILTGIKVVDEESMQKAAAKLHALGIKVVLITIGSQGSFYSMDGQSGIVPAFKVNAVDTTAAGDTFIGALSTVLKPDFSNLVEAITYGNKASSLTVQRFGAQPSIPYKHELN